MKKLFEKHESLFCILLIVIYVLVNSLSIFNVENVISLYVVSAFLIIVPLWYAGYINRKVKE